MDLVTTMGRAVRAMMTAAEAPVPATDAALHSLRLLGILRLCAPVFQAVTVFVAVQLLEVSIPVVLVVMLILVEAAAAALTWVRLGSPRRVSPFELFAHVQLEIAIYAAMLYVTGGTTNPFAPLFLLPLVIVASALRPRWVWVVAITTILAYALLRTHHLPLHHPAGHTEVYELHEDGMVVNFMLSAAMLAFFCNWAHASLRRSHQMLADARETQIRNDSVVAIGALAAGHAHELSSPLSSIAVVADELRLSRPHDEALQRELAIIASEVEACKRIVSRLAEAGGRRRAERACTLPADEFVRRIVNSAITLYPGATIVMREPPSTPVPGIVAEDSLRQTIMNLVQNAAQASPDHVEVVVDWSAQELTVTVLDHGPGLPPEVIDRVGKYPVSTKGDDGMGLGLLLSVITLERLGGRLELSNHPEGGARATVRVPLQAIAVDARNQV